MTNLNGVFETTLDANLCLKFERYIMNEDTCDVTVSLGHTKNLGNFESLRLDVSIRLTGPAEDKERLYKEASEWTGKKIKEFFKKDKKEE